MDKPKRLIVDGPLWRSLRDAIYDCSIREQVAGVILRPDGDALRAVELHVVPDDCVVSTIHGLEWNARFNVYLMKRARVRAGGVMIAHAHPSQKLPCFSSADAHTANVLFHFFGRELAGSTNVMAVFGRGYSFYAVADHCATRCLVREITTEG